MTTPTVRRRARGALLGAAALGALLAGLVAAGPAVAIPPDGPGPDTPGTASSVSPTTLTPCSTIGYTVSGYPAGETLYIKIDDGVGYGDTSVQGSGVFATAAINSSGSASGSFELPCDIAPGAHWLRMLASQYVNPSDPGAGVLGFTRRGGNDFAVVPGGSGGGGGDVGVGGAAPGAGQTAGSGAEQVAGSGATLGIDPSLVAPAATPTPTPSAAPARTATPAPTPLAAAVPADPAAGTGDGIPLVGLIGGGVLVLAGVAVAVWLLLRRGRTAAVHS